MTHLPTLIVGIFVGSTVMQRMNSSTTTSSSSSPTIVALRDHCEFARMHKWNAGGAIQRACNSSDNNNVGVVQDIDITTMQLMKRIKQYKVVRDVSKQPMGKLPNKRPAKRTFTSVAVDNVVKVFSERMVDNELAQLFWNCFPNTLDTTVKYFSSNGPDTFIITGDIPAQWLRDSTNQVLPYVDFAPLDKKLSQMLCGLIRRQVSDVLVDPFANAFNMNYTIKGREEGSWQKDRRVPPMQPHVFEGKYELDSLAAILKLSRRYYESTKSLECFDGVWTHGIRLIVDMMKLLSKGTTDAKSKAKPLYSFRRNRNELHHDGLGHPATECGLVRSGFRPSDDPCKFPYLIPANMMSVVELSGVVEILEKMIETGASRTYEVHKTHVKATLYRKIPSGSVVDLTKLAKEADDLANRIDVALRKHGRKANQKYYSYEIDGATMYNDMDDANLPSLLSIPYLGYMDKNDKEYIETRKFVLSRRNPYYFPGKMATGVGSPHTYPRSIWPMSIIMQALTSDSDTEIKQCLEWIKISSANTGLLHESFNMDRPESFSRKWFAWVNTLFGELIVRLARERPYLLFKT